MEQTNPNIEERIREAVADAIRGGVVGSRNLVVCIDGTANQFGVKVSLQAMFSVFDCLFIAFSCFPPTSDRIRT